MINVLTFKCGSKYDYRSVNMLYRSILWQYDKPFNFHCMTDDPTNLDDRIIIHPMQDDFPYEFNSLSLVKSGFAGIEDGEPCILLDIDIEVVNDPSPIFDFQLLPKQIGFIHKWWTYPYTQGSFICGMAYRFTAGELDIFYNRFKEDPYHYTTKYIEFNGRKHKLKEPDIHVRGEQDYFLECAGIYNFHMNLFPSFWAENVQPELEFEGYTIRSPRLEKYVDYKSMSNMKMEPIFKHYTGIVKDYVDKHYELYR